MVILPKYYLFFSGPDDDLVSFFVIEHIGTHRVSIFLPYQAFKACSSSVVQKVNSCLIFFILCFFSGEIKLNHTGNSLIVGGKFIISLKKPKLILYRGKSGVGRNLVVGLNVQ